MIRPIFQFAPSNTIAPLFIAASCFALDPALVRSCRAGRYSFSQRLCYPDTFWDTVINWSLLVVHNRHSCFLQESELVVHAAADLGWWLAARILLPSSYEVDCSWRTPRPVRLLQVPNISAKLFQLLWINSSLWYRWTFQKILPTTRRWPDCTK